MKLVKINTLISWSSLKESRILLPEEYTEYSFERKPDLPGKLIYVSHRWITRNHPDPEGIQLRELKYRLKILCDQNDNLENALVFYDYCSLPQRPRTDQEDILFLRDLKSLRNISRSSEKVIILSEGYQDYKNRTWCFFELLIAEGNTHLFEDQDHIKEDIQFRNALLPRYEAIGVDGAWITSGSFKYDMRYPEMEAIVALFQHLDLCKATHPEDVPLVRSEVIRYYNSRNMSPFGRFLTGVAKFFEMSVIIVPVEGNDIAPTECRPYFDAPTWKRLPTTDDKIFSILSVPSLAYGIVDGFVPILRLRRQEITDGEMFVRRYYDAKDWKNYVVSPPMTIIYGANHENNAFPTLDHVVHTALEFMGGLAIGPDCLYLRLDDKV